MFSEQGNKTISHSYINLIIQKGKVLHHFLNEKECTELTKLLDSQDDDAIRKSIELDKQLLIPGLLFREMKKMKSFKKPGKCHLSIFFKIKY